MNDELVFRLRKRAEIRRSIDTRKSVQNNEVDRIAALLDEAADRIAELEKETNAKPVAYIDHVSGKPKLIGGYVVDTPSDIPLYTTPQTKPLTDEEIRQLNWNTTDMIEFARAIEAKIRGER